MRRILILTFAASSVVVGIACSGGSGDDIAGPAPTADGGGGSSSSGADTSSSSSSTSSSSSSSTSSSSTSSSSGNPAFAVSAGCAAFADGYCDFATKCSPIILTIGFADLASCKERLGISCTLGEKSPNAAQMPITCGPALKTLNCDGSSGGPDIGTCAIKGTGAIDSICEYDVQCDSTSCIKPNSDANCGKCTARAAATEACGPTKDCASGLVCVANACRTPIAKDADCTGLAGACKTPFRCVGNKCIDPVLANAACTKAPAGSDDPCDASKVQFCKVVGSATTGTCGTFTVAKVNEACGIVSNDFVLCGGGLDCAGTFGASKCLPMVADGAMCEADGGVKCMNPAECAASKCSFPDPARCK